MPIIKLVRHAEPSATWGAHPDPGLSDLGHEQAAIAAQKLGASSGFALITSPLARCRQTSAATESLLSLSARVEQAVAEIPVPKEVTDHRAWLTAVMSGAWDDVHVAASLRDWRDGVAAALLALEQDTIVFSHFVAINAAVGVATNSATVTTFKPGHASITTLESRGGSLHLVELGNEAPIHLT